MRAARALALAVLARANTSELFYVHIPKTGGSSIVASMADGADAWATVFGLGYDGADAWATVYPWTRECGALCVHVDAAGARHTWSNNNGRDHIAPDDLIACGHVPADFFEGKEVLCTVRDPFERFVSEVNQRAALAPATSVGDVMRACEAARPANFSFWAHCRPQAAYAARCTTLVLTRDIDERGAAALARHGVALRRARVNASVRRYATRDLSEAARAWIRAFYASDFALVERAEQERAACSASDVDPARAG